MFESMVLALGWMFFFFLVAFFGIPMLVGSCEFWMHWFRKLKAIRAARREHVGS